MMLDVCWPQAEALRRERAASELEELTLRPEISGLAQKLRAAEGDGRQPAWQRLASRKAEKVQVWTMVSVGIHSKSNQAIVFRVTRNQVSRV